MCLWISGNEGQLHQVLVNLVENAVYAMRATEKPRLTVSASRKANEIVIKVTDNGSEIDKDHITHIFAPFFTTKRAGEGTGLGLWISYGIVPRAQRRTFRHQRARGRSDVLVCAAGCVELFRL